VVAFIVIAQDVFQAMTNDGRDSSRPYDAMREETNSVKLGFVPSDPQTRFQAVREMALAAEDAGFASFWLADHFLHRSDGHEEGLWEVFTIWDNYSRNIMASSLFRSQDVTSYLIVLREAFAQFGLPEALTIAFGDTPLVRYPIQY
jgi:hypothetical protein